MNKAETLLSKRIAELEAENEKLNLRLSFCSPQFASTELHYEAKEKTKTIF